MKLSWEEVARYALEAGWDKETAITAVAVARAESNFRTTAVSPSGCCHGIWQINARAHRGKFTRITDLYKPAINAAVAFKVWQERGRAVEGPFGAGTTYLGGSFEPWDVFRSGAYKKYRKRARQAVDQFASGTYKTAVGPMPVPAGWTEERKRQEESKGGTLFDLPGNIAEALWPVLLKSALAATGLALLGHGVVKIVGGGGAAQRVKQVAPTAATVARAAK